MKAIPLILTICLIACTPRAVREAEKVVTQADSMWQAGKMYGVDEGDSVSLAQAYETLQEHSAFSRQLSEVCPFVHCTSLLRTYSHACYHYGKLLRAKDNPVAAMQVFIAATHSHTRDYHILGRVYSNMGDICHLAGEYPLSYDMFERSADMFLRNGDTLLYYYGLNNMAFELAEQGKKEEVFSMLSIIDEQYSDPYIYAKTWETKAELYRIIGQYDSAIYCVNKYKELGYSEANTIIIMAQAYDELGKRDSALVYAQMILADSSSCYQNRFNALYIASHYDSTLCASEISELNSQREDIRYYEYEPQKEKLTEATQLLSKTLNHKPDLTWLYSICCTILLIGICLFIYTRRKRKRQELLSQELDILEQATTAIQKKHNDLTECYLTEHKRIEDEINNRCSMLQTNESIKKKLAWRDYKKMCNIVDKQFYLLASKLHDKHSLKETEIRICILTLLNCSSEQMAELLYKSPTSIGTLKRRVAHKLETTSAEMRSHLIENVCIR